MASPTATVAAIVIVIIILIGGAFGLLYLYPKLPHIVPSVGPNNSTLNSSSTSSSFSIPPSSNRTVNCIGNCSTADLIGTRISAQLYGNLTGVSFSTLAKIGNASGNTPPKAISGSNLTNNGKPEVLFIGAQYCPYCMAETWSLIIALSKFGNFSGLDYMLSATNYNYSNTAGFTFIDASYTSQYISFVSVEYENRNQAALQPISNSQASLEKKYDSHLQIPFVDLGNQYAVAGSQYDPGVLSNLNWTQIASQLNNSNSSLARSIDGAANTLISAICRMDGGSPQSVCSQSFANFAMPLLMTAWNMILLWATEAEARIN